MMYTGSFSPDMDGFVIICNLFDIDLFSTFIWRYHADCTATRK